MKGALITKTKKSLRLALSPWEMFTHYFPVLFVFFVGLIPLWWAFEIKFIDSYDGVKSAEEMFTISWPWLVLGSILMVIQWRRLKMQKIKVIYTDEELNEAISRTAQELEWLIENNNKQVLVAHRPWSWTGSWGERVTIVKLRDGLLLNSICDPDRPASVTSFGWNRKNLKSFVDNLAAVQEGEPSKLKEEKITNESEWTFKKIMMRLLAYPLSLFFIALFCLFVYLQMNFVSIIVSIIPAAFAVVYLYSDIKIILNKRKTNTQHSV